MVKPKFKKLIRKTKGKRGPKVSGTKSLINNYFTRAQALRKLQITLKAFRRLCILKGIYPREPSKNLKANKQKTYYHAKDIMFLLHDPLLETFRQIQTYKKKVVKAKARGETTRLAMLMENRPRYPLEHILKQRYPTFIDALKELDDALSMIFLFAQFPQTQKIKLERVEHCQTLCFEFMNYIVFTRSLEKAFLSVRGIYYQVNINGQPIVWLTPYHFTQKLPKKVDYRVMLAFLDLYEQLVSFSLFKLYHDVGLAYPPLLDKKKDEDCEGLSSFRLITLSDASKDTTDESSKPKAAKPKKQGQKLPKELSKKLQQIEQTEADQEAEAVDTDSTLGSDMFDKKKRLFQNLHFFLDRETPLLALEFIIRSFGGRVSFHDRSDPSITHQVVDRPFIKEKVLGRTYIQPQYVFDCINAGIMLPTHEYLPGVVLPPHLSPFVDDDKEGYVPDRKAEIQRLVDKAQGFAAEYGNALDLTDFQDLTGDQNNDEDEIEAPQDEEEIDMNEEEVGEDGEVVIKRSAAPQEEEGEEDGEDKPLSNRALKKKKQQRKEAKKLAKLMSKTPEERQEMEETELKKSLLSSTKRKLYDKLTSQDKRQQKKNKILQDRKERIQKRKQKETQQQDTNTVAGQSATNKKRKVQ